MSMEEKDSAAELAAQLPTPDYPERNFDRPAREGYKRIKEAGVTKSEPCDLYDEDGNLIRSLTEIIRRPIDSWNVANSE